MTSESKVAVPSFWLLVVTFFAGAALMAYEIVGSRLLAPYFGNSIFVWGSLIGVFLGALSIGYAYGGRVADRHPTENALSFLLCISSLLVAASVLIADELQRQIVSIDIGTRLNPLVASIVLFAPASILMGMVSPYVVRLRAKTMSDLGATVGGLYGISTAGSIFGTLVAAFWMVENLGTEHTVLGVAITLGACAALAGFAQRQSLAPIGLSAGTLLIVGTILASGAGSGASVGSTYRGVGTGFSPVFHAGGYKPEFEPSGDGKLLAKADTQYHRIRVVDYPAGIFAPTPTRVMHFDNSSQAAAAIVDGEPKITGAPVFSYLRSVELVPAIRPKAKRVLFVGLGSGAAVMRLHELRPNLKIDVVELDPKVVELAHKWFGYSDSKSGIEQIKTYVADGRSWLAGREDSKYDAIVVDVYFSDSIPFHMTTVEFLRMVKKHMTNDGILATNLIGAVEGSKNELLRSFHRTYSEVFGDVVLYPVPVNDGEAPTLNDFVNVEFFSTAKRGVLPPFGAEATLIENAEMAVSASSILDHQLQGILNARYRERVSHKGVPVLTDDLAPVDSLLAIDGI